MSEQTIPLREQVAQAIYTEWDRQLFERGTIPYRLPWALAEGVAQERYLLSADAALAVISAQPRPEMAEIEAAVDELIGAAEAYGSVITQGDESGIAIIESEAQDGETDSRCNLLALIERALAVPAGHVVVPVDDLTEILNQHEFMVENDMTSPENEVSYRSLRALLPERGDE